jgi:hypothetical protein
MVIYPEQGLERQVTFVNGLYSFVKIIFASLIPVIVFSAEELLTERFGNWANTIINLLTVAIVAVLPNLIGLILAFINTKPMKTKVEAKSF